jgi:hypothetical protein
MMVCVLQEGGGNRSARRVLLAQEEVGIVRRRLLHLPPRSRCRQGKRRPLNRTPHLCMSCNIRYYQANMSDM